ncbi:MAG: hypothetical protein Q8L15_05985 [Methylobacter sp.]|nr:hypothetical protein [Methylobacter sp.]
MKITLLKQIMLYCLGLALPFAVIAQNSLNHKTTAPVLILPAPNEGEAKDDESLPPDMYLPGLDYQSGKDWWALSCGDDTDADADTNTCKITPSVLKVSRSPFSPYGSSMDSDPIEGQKLHWLPGPPVGTLLMFKFNPTAKLVKPTAGPVETYYYPVKDKDIFRKNTLGMTESELVMPNGIKAQLLPVLVLPNSKDKVVGDQLSNLLTLELRIGAKRQTLIKNGFSAYNQDYLAWAGDLDSDGKLDLLINTGSCSNEKNIALFLSSLAKPDELLGEAGRFEEDKGC